MNKSELIEIIREVVRTELKNSGPRLIKEALIESLGSGGNTAVSEKITFEEPSTFKSVMAEEIPSAPRKPRPFVKYSSNPVLNEVMNQTEGGVPQDGSGVVSDGGAIPSKVDILMNAPREVLQENSPLNVVAKALKKDYRSLLKAADSVAKKHR
jgi:hypothetical protein